MIDVLILALGGIAWLSVAMYSYKRNIKRDITDEDT